MSLQYLFNAIRRGKTIKVISELISDDVINQQNRNGVTLLMYAVDKNRLDIVEFLVKNGANVNAQDNDGLTALIAAALMGYIEIVDFLVKNGANVNAQDNDGLTALIGNAIMWYINIVQFCGQKCAQDKDLNHKQIQELLLTHGANDKSCDLDLILDAISQCQDPKQTNDGDKDLIQEVVKLLMEHGIVNAVQTTGASAAAYSDAPQITVQSASDTTELD
jgi:hypothetical protein